MDYLHPITLLIQQLVSMIIIIHDNHTESCELFIVFECDVITEYIRKVNCIIIYKKTTTTNEYRNTCVHNIIIYHSDHT